MAGMNTLERTTFLICCPSCGQGTSKTLAWLMDERAMRCPICSAIIDLNGIENGPAIKKLIESALSADVDTGERK